MAKTSGKIVDKDHGYKALMKRIGEAGKARVLVGIQEDEGGSHAGGATVADVAMFMEFGTVNVPQRSFLRAWVDEKQAEIRKVMSKLAEGLVTGKTPNRFVALDRFGLWAVGNIQARIVAGIDPPLAESTMRRKGSSTPLIDTGLLKSAIRHRVENA